MLHGTLPILVRINLRPLSHLWVHAIKRELRRTQFYPSEFKDHCSQTLDYLPGPLTFLPSTLRITHAASRCPFFPPLCFSHNVLTLWGTEQFDLVCAIWVKRVKKTLRHGSAFAPRVAKRSLPRALHIATNLFSWSLFTLSPSCLTGSF